eukprot:2304927-Rhodomonas_salina.1
MRQPHTPPSCSEHPTRSSGTDGTAMFIYVDGYCETLLEHGATATIDWTNSGYTALDACISRRRSDNVKQCLVVWCLRTVRCVSLCDA